MKCKSYRREFSDGKPSIKKEYGFNMFLEDIYKDNAFITSEIISNLQFSYLQLLFTTHSEDYFPYL